MSLSLQAGIPIAKIVNPETGEQRIVYLDNDSKEAEEDLEQLMHKLLDEGVAPKDILQIVSQKGVREIKTKKGETVIVLPSERSERAFIAGRAGMGKSTLAKMYMIEYEAMNPNNEIFLISRHAYDDVYDDVIKGISHIVVSPEILDYKMELDDMRDSLVVFDDVDNLQDAKISKYVHQLVDDLISNGRKYNIFVLYLGHQLSNYSKTRNITNEANKVFFFPGGSTYHIKEFLIKKIGIDKMKAMKIMNLKSRWVCLSLMMPFHVIHEGGVFLI